MTWVATAIALVGAATQQYNQHKTEKKRDRRLAGQIRQQAEYQDQADAQVAQLLSERQASTSEPERQNTSQQYLDQVRAAQGAANRGLNQGGAVSDAYRASANAAALGISDYGNTAANLMARIDAPQQQRTRERLESGNLASQLGLIGRRASSADFLGQLQLQSIRDNPWLTAAAGVAQGVSSGLSSRGGARAGTDSVSSQANNITASNNARLFARSQNSWR